jgi:hypothetical protein
MEQNKNFERQFQVKAYFVFGVAMYIFFYRLISNSMMAQMDRPPFIFGETESVYKLFLLTGIPQFLTSNSFIAALTDISILITTVAFLMKFKRILAILFSILVLNYFLTYNIVTGHHYHGLAGLLVITIPFWFKSEQRFNFAWEAVRYYFLYIFASAALWKIFRGSAFYQDQLSDILKSQQINLLLQNPDIFRAHVVEYLIANTGISHIILLANALLQLTFAIGFFTKKYDHLLFILAIVFVIANYFVMSIVSAELLILNLTLLNWDKVEAYLIKQGVVSE